MFHLFTRACFFGFSVRGAHRDRGFVSFTERAKLIVLQNRFFYAVCVSFLQNRSFSYKQAPVCLRVVRVVPVPAF
jgi:hypothetical protein